MVWTVGQLLESTRGKLAAGDVLMPVGGVSLDSRRLHAGDAFVALRGARFDAHAFLPEALSRGASCLIVSRLPAPGLLAHRFADAASRNGAGHPPASAILVDDTTRALGAIASFHRMRFNGPVVAITGSCGKTTTKELLAHLLGSQRQVLKTDGTQNNQIGLPLTLLRVSEAQDAVVVELGSNHPGEIASLASIARPTAAIITNIGPAHLEFFGSLSGVFQEKLSLVEALTTGGVAIVPGDQLDVVIEAARRLPSGVRMVTFGASDRCDVQAMDIQRRRGAWNFRLRGLHEEFVLPLPGSHNLENALAALAGVWALGVPLESVRDALPTFRTLSMRSEVIACGSVTLLNDCYNANPLSFARSLEMLEELDAMRRVVIAGDMAELGDYAAGAHHAIGRLAAQRGADLVIAVGTHASHIEEGARDAGCRRVWTYRDVSELLRELPRLVQAGDAVLVKGSRRLHLEQVSEWVQEQFQTAPRAGASAAACPAS